MGLVFRFTPVELLEEHIRRLEAEAAPGSTSSGDVGCRGDL